MTNKIRCQCCGKELPPGSLKYVVEIKTFADYDGYIDENSGDLEEDMLDLIEEMSDIDSKTLEEDVYKEMMFILCKDCRARFIKDPFCVEKEMFEDEHTKGTVH